MKLATLIRGPEQKMHLSRTDQAVLRRLEKELSSTRPDDARVLSRILRNDKTPSQYVTTSEAASILGVTSQTVRNWVDRGWLPAKRPRPFAHRRIERRHLDSVADIRARIDRQGIVTKTDGEIDALLSRHREDRQRARVGEPLAESRPARSATVEMAGRS